ncbi:AMP-binding protein [Novosphingobium sp. Gsoil 351]|nr:class I adenylate-forming enzyme family protein [Novosphingobium sp. Gsoil 351]QGN55456.1 AMP-binding protein [Novosphingobium sp. Gsoil 351]
MSTRFPTGNLGDIIARAPQADGAYIDTATGRSLTMPELDTAAARLAGGFAQQFSRGTRVAILARNGTPLILSYLALMRAGLVAVPVSHRLPADTIGYILEDSQSEAALIDAPFAELLPASVQAIDFGGAEFAELSSGEPLDPVRAAPGELCEILYTSGSTGRPKGVPLDHAGQLWALNLFVEATGTDPQSTVIVAPAYHMNGLFFTTVALALGWRTFSMPAFDPRAFLELVAAERLTLLSGIPTMFAMMARQTDLVDELDLRSVEAVTIGSAPLTQALIDRVRSIFPNAAVRNSYGTTESGPAMFGPHPDGLERPPLALGYPYPGVEWRLVDGTPSQGKLLTRTPAVMRGYLNLPEVNAERLNDGWYDTGDIVRYDEDGFFYFVGRADDMFVCGGRTSIPARSKSSSNATLAYSKPRSSRPRTRSRGRSRSRLWCDRKMQQSTSTSSSNSRCPMGRPTPTQGQLPSSMPSPWEELTRWIARR